ncbi:glutamine-hydrolyzing carbamoyl-phosphate synthase small subunit [Candidatus Micrarchaeota archaeon]|nr:glutamine-hydrolyzing carbamoyl-phosphate synthase small subunit [Candidatus Micrarchaeota archaeon]
MKAVLALKDGTILHGIGFGAEAVMAGELVFNTSMCGYQEALTDPSYGGQILLMTYPLIGNYGINAVDNESSKIHASGFVVREMSPDYSHRQAEKSLHEFLAEKGIPGIHGLDTRFLVKKIRSKGVMPAIIAASKNGIDTDSLLGKMGEFDYSGVDFVAKAGVEKPEVFGRGGKHKVAMLDLGMKMGIVRELVKRDCEVHALPAYSSAEEVEAIEADGIMLSNGPGDPAILEEVHKTVRRLIGAKPVFGVCLGHQVIAHAMGGSTYKLKFGHRGCNHAVLDIESGKVAITTQNHGFAVDKVPEGFELTKINANDKSVEGMKCENKDVVCVQYHPEASPGPHDSTYLFDEFVARIGK